MRRERRQVSGESRPAAFRQKQDGRAVVCASSSGYPRRCPVQSNVRTRRGWLRSAWGVRTGFPFLLRHQDQAGA
jgi:hypothetical protein